MAEKRNEDSTKRPQDGQDNPFRTEYVHEERPNLPDANVSVTRDDPVIDKRLVEARNAEAKANAARVKG